MADHKAKDAPQAEAPDAAPALAVAFTPAPELTERIVEERAGVPHCPQCGRALTLYDGANPHKRGTLECARCHLRVAGDARS